MESVHQSVRFRVHAWRQFRKNKPAYFSLFVLLVLVIIALLAPLLANERPLYLRYDGQNFYPAFSPDNIYSIVDEKGHSKRIQLDIADWKHLKAEKIIWAPIPYSPGKGDYLNSNFIGPWGDQKFLDQNNQVVPMPTRFRHWLGTGIRGDDLLSGLIHGTQISLTIGFFSMAIATVIGILLGAFAGFFGDDQLFSSRGRSLVVLLGLVFAWFYAFQVRSNTLTDALGNSGLSFLLQLLFSLFIFIFVVTIFSWLGKLTGKLPWLNKQVNIPADSIISRFIEIIVSLPTFMVILAIAAISKPSIFNVMAIIGLTSWTGIARITRAEMMRVRHMEYIQSAKALGFRKRRIILRHALPNAIAPALVMVSFGIAGAILTESALSFIGVGVPSGVTTWGSLLNDGREKFNAWWMIIFPGLFIFITVTAYNLIGEGLRDATDPKMKQ